MICKQKDCTKEATHTVYWPNQVTQQCYDCAQRVVALGQAMGFNVPLVAHVELKTPPKESE